MIRDFLHRLSPYIIVACIVGMTLFYLQQSSTNQDLVHRLQQARITSRFNGCLAQNRRNRATIRVLRDLRNSELKSTPGHPSTPEQVIALFRAAGVTVLDPKPIILLETQSIKASFASTADLIDALAPVTPNCLAYAHSTHSSGAHPVTQHP